MKTMIAIPCMDTLPLGFVQSLLYAEKGENVTVQFKANSLIYDSRNLLSLMAIEDGFDRVMWIDSDMMFTHSAIKMLHDDMDQYKCDMVTGLYFKRTGMSLPVIYEELEIPTEENGKPVRNIHEYMNYPPDSMFPVRGCGFGFVMTSTKLLKEVWDKYGPAFTPYPWAGEDISFCHRVNQLGHVIWCDSRITCGHIGTWVFTEDTYKAMRGDTNGEQ